MRIILKSAAIALALATTSLGSAGAASAGDYGYDAYRGDYNRGYDRSVDNRYDRYRRHHHRHAAMRYGNIAVVYSDGYFDNDHRWHRWHNDRGYYHHGDYNRGHDNGW
jgi:hypothetical protein